MHEEKGQDGKGASHILEEPADGNAYTNMLRSCLKPPKCVYSTRLYPQTRRGRQEKPSAQELGPDGQDIETVSTAQAEMWRLPTLHTKQNAQRANAREKHNKTAGQLLTLVSERDKLNYWALI